MRFSYYFRIFGLELYAGRSSERHPYCFLQRNDSQHHGNLEAGFGRVRVAVSWPRTTGGTR